MLPLVRTNRTMPGFFLDELFNNNLWSDFLEGDKNSEKSNLPAVNVEETNKEFIISVAAPGLNKEDFHITVENDTLTIASSSKNTKEEEEQNNFLHREFNYQTFSRSFTLPENSKADKITASHKNGMLNISIAKEEVKIQKAKEININ